MSQHLFIQFQKIWLRQFRVGENFDLSLIPNENQFFDPSFLPLKFIETFCTKNKDHIQMTPLVINEPELLNSVQEIELEFLKRWIITSQKQLRGH